MARILLRARVELKVCIMYNSKPCVLMNLKSLLDRLENAARGKLDE